MLGYYPDEKREAIEYINFCVIGIFVSSSPEGMINLDVLEILPYDF
jgi:hypothetical protein